MAAAGAGAPCALQIPAGILPGAVLAISPLVGASAFDGAIGVERTAHVCRPARLAVSPRVTL